MADDTQDSVWPLPKFAFTVAFGDLDPVAFQEVTGLSAETQAIEYRHGDSPAFSPIKMPGIAKIGNVVLKKGVFRRDSAFWDWFNQIKLNTIKRQTEVIRLLDEAGGTAMRWTLTNAWPTKITGTDMKSDGNEVAIQTIEIAYEGLTVATP